MNLLQNRSKISFKSKTVLSILALACFSLPKISYSAEKNTQQDFVTGKITPEQLDMDSVSQAVATYLVQHPEFLVAASETLRQQQKIAYQQAMAQAALGQLTGLLHSELTPFIGKPEAPVAIVAFIDFSQQKSFDLLSNLLNLSVKYPTELRVIIKGISPPNTVNSHDNDIVISAGILIHKDKGESVYKQFLEKLMLPRSTPMDIHALITLIESITNREYAVELNKKLMNDPQQSLIRENLILAESLGIKNSPSVVIVPRTDANIVNTTVLTESLSFEAISQGLLRAGVTYSTTDKK